MPYLNNAKFKEIKTAAQDGNEKAKMVLQALRQGQQTDVDRLVQDYYSIPVQDMNDVPIETELQDNPMENTAEANATTIQAGEVDPGSDVTVPMVEDLTDVLDKETDGLFDENEIEPVDFSKFLNNKRRDNMRAKKNSDYFKAFNPESVNNYVNAKKDKYKAKFGDSLHDIEKQFTDYDKSIDRYTQGVSDLLEDNVEINTDVANNAYDDITNNSGIMHSFGRHWDEDDTNNVIEDLKQLVAQYGKKNVLAALNVLKTDNGNFRDYRLGQINEEVERYNKSLDKMIK